MGIATTIRARSRSATPSPAQQFADLYLASLLELAPRDVPRSPCFAYGRGGVAHALLRASTWREDASLLAHAQRWVDAGLRSARRFRMRGWPRASYSRGFAGLHALAARVAHRRGDAAARGCAITAFADTVRRARGSVELFAGLAGRLAGSATLAREIGDDEQLAALTRDLGERLAQALDARDHGLARTGLAHGLPGPLLALVVWGGDAGLARRLDALPAYDGPSADWAHGHAGMAFLFARAHRLLGDPALLARARSAAERAWAAAPRHPALMDGATGVAYALHALAVEDPDGPWRERRDTLLETMLATIDVPPRDPYGAWSGLTALFCLAVDTLESACAFPGIDG